MFEFAHCTVQIRTSLTANAYFRSCIVHFANGTAIEPTAGK
ncbi:hypothetical protein [Pedobacter frigoris]|nr:hypothetical protein [Pedobacter frigoris]